MENGRARDQERLHLRYVSDRPVANPGLMRSTWPGPPQCLDLEAAVIDPLDRQPRAFRVLAGDILYRLPGHGSRNQVEAPVQRDTKRPVTFTCAPRRARSCSASSGSL